LEAEQPRGFDVVLTVGKCGGIRDVTATAGGLQTENASIKRHHRIAGSLTLPQFGKDPYELIHMAPGVFGDNARQGGGNSLPCQQVGPGVQ